MLNLLLLDAFLIMSEGGLDQTEDVMLLVVLLDVSLAM